MKLKLINRLNETEDVKTFIFKTEKPFPWNAGQYLIYSLPHQNSDLRGKIRFFTISSAPFEKNLNITTKIDKKNSSSFKKTLDTLKIGDEINAKGPDGDFVLDKKDKNLIFIAGGIGITPFYSIIKQLDHEKKFVNITLLYANKTKNNIPFINELKKITKKYRELKIYYFISPEIIDKNVLKKYTDKKNIFYISGPDKMVETIESELLSLGITIEKIKEDYFPGYKGI